MQRIRSWFTPKRQVVKEPFGPYMNSVRITYRAGPQRVVECGFSALVAVLLLYCAMAMDPTGAFGALWGIVYGLVAATKPKWVLFRLFRPLPPDAYGQEWSEEGRQTWAKLGMPLPKETAR